MFRLAAERKVLWPVEVREPRDGQIDIHEIKVLFKLLDEDGLQQLTSGPSALAVLERHVLGWEGICDESGTAIPFNEETRKALISIPLISRPLAVALTRLSQGEAVTKNSKSGSAG
jgi:hypothetical protein